MRPGSAYPRVKLKGSRLPGRLMRPGPCWGRPATSPRRDVHQYVPCATTTRQRWRDLTSYRPITIDFSWSIIARWSRRCSDLLGRVGYRSVLRTLERCRYAWRACCFPTTTMLMHATCSRLALSTKSSGYMDHCGLPAASKRTALNDSDIWCRDTKLQYYCTI